MVNENFKNYFLNEEGYTLVEKEYGFFAYSFDPEYKSMFLAHLYVAPEARKNGKTNELFRIIRLRAKSLGAKQVVGNCFLNDANKDNYSKKILLHLRYGYKIIGVHENCITLVKELDNEMDN
jgi:hypothetical protein